MTADNVPPEFAFALADALLQVPSKRGDDFAVLFEHGTLKLEVYAPNGRDTQTPHARDEVYVIARGSGVFFCDGQRTLFTSGDALFVPAGVEHRFEDFSDDFATWVMFYGPVGGESSLIDQVTTA